MSELTWSNESVILTVDTSTRALARVGFRARRANVGLFYSLYDRKNYGKTTRNKSSIVQREQLVNALLCMNRFTAFLLQLHSCQSL